MFLHSSLKVPNIRQPENLLTNCCSPLFLLVTHVIEGGRVTILETLNIWYGLYVHSMEQISKDMLLYHILLIFIYAIDWWNCDFLQIRAIPRPIDVPDSGLVCDLLWGDPAEVSSILYMAQIQQISCHFTWVLMIKCYSQYSWVPGLVPII